MFSVMNSAHLNRLAQAAAASVYKGGEIQQLLSDEKTQKDRQLRFLLRKAQQAEAMQKPSASPNGQMA